MTKDLKTINLCTHPVESILEIVEIYKDQQVHRERFICKHCSTEKDRSNIIDSYTIDGFYNRIKDQRFTFKQVSLV